MKEILFFKLASMIQIIKAFGYHLLGKKHKI